MFVYNICFYKNWICTPPLSISQKKSKRSIYEREREKGEPNYVFVKLGREVVIIYLIVDTENRFL